MSIHCLLPAYSSSWSTLGLRSVSISSGPLCLPVLGARAIFVHFLLSFGGVKVWDLFEQSPKGVVSVLATWSHPLFPLKDCLPIFNTLGVKSALLSSRFKFKPPIFLIFISLPTSLPHPTTFNDWLDASSNWLWLEAALLPGFLHHKACVCVMH